MRRLVLLSIAAAALCLPAVKAGTLYTINFSGGSPNPTSGSFTYDPSTGFSNFTVVWEGSTIDLTASANAPAISGTGCGGEASTPAYAFAIMSQAVTGCPTAPTYGWLGVLRPSASEDFFEFDVLSFTGLTTGEDSIITSFAGPSELTDTHGPWTITAVTTAAPEPAGAFLSTLGMAFLGIAVARQWRRAGR
jgi:hypothetical protein